LPQIWSVLADFDRERSILVMDALERELNVDIGLLICKPPYAKDLHFYGDMSRPSVGVRENGGVYLHASAWKLAVDGILGRNDKVEEGIHKILPGHHQYEVKYGEPYVLFNAYMGEQTGYRFGTPGQSWRTAAGQWFMYALVKFVFGMQPNFEGLVIKPTLPTSWKDCSITKTLRGCTYNIRFIQKDDGGCNNIESITVNGVAVDPTRAIPAVKGETLNVEVVLTNK
jgi:cellobiose phosphorylase